MSAAAPARRTPAVRMMASVILDNLVVLGDELPRIAGAARCLSRPDPNTDRPVPCLSLDQSGG
jgi:hypothetical protein